MKWPKRKPGFKDEVLWKLNALHHLYIELNTRDDKKEHKRTWKEPAKWKMDKLPDGKWQFEWEDTNRGGHGQLTGNFNQCLEGMKRFEFVLLEDTIPDASNAPVDNDSPVPEPKPRICYALSCAENKLGRCASLLRSFYSSCVDERPDAPAPLDDEKRVSSTPPDHDLSDASAIIHEMARKGVEATAAPNSPTLKPKDRYMHIQVGEHGEIVQTVDVEEADAPVKKESDTR